MCQNTQEKIGVQYEKLSQEELIFALQLATAREGIHSPQKSNHPLRRDRTESEKSCGCSSIHIKNHHFFDILVSSKFGVVRPDIEGEYSFFYDADGLFLGFGRLI